MKKLSLAFALLLVLAFATSAFAAQATFTVGGQTYYIQTSTGTLANETNISNATYGRMNRFSADGISNYPYEIYLPNEKNPAQYRIHSNYSKNTDACASCHATHTAVGDSLLQWYSAYETCMACHDGTVTTTYNVEDGKIGITGSATKGGMFDLSGTSVSSHNVAGAVTIAAAPGGSTVGVTTNKVAQGAAGNEVNVTSWTPEFGCQSCHEPHGNGGNARILNPDPNGAATVAKAEKYFVDPSGYVYAEAGFVNKVSILRAYPYVCSVVYADGTVNTVAKVDNSEGYSKVTGVDVATVGAVYGIAGIRVAMNIDNYLLANESVEHISGMNAFCGACHTDYNTNAGGVVTGSGKEETGVYSKAHRHQVGNNVSSFDLAGTTMPLESNRLECLTCHVAHGVTSDYWARTLGPKSATVGDAAYNATGYFALTDLVELSGSSALKRMPNMGTCEACHAKGDGNQGYGANTNAAQVALADTTNGLFAPGGGFVNDDAKCVTCHTTYCTNFATTAHAAEGCESCHGQAANHILVPSAMNIVNPASFSKAQQSLGTVTGGVYRLDGTSGWLDASAEAKACGYCHTTAGAEYKESDHFLSGTVSCNTCHNAHKDNGTNGQLSAISAEALCATCHGKDVTLATYMPGKTHDFAASFVATYADNNGKCTVCHRSQANLEAAATVPANITITEFAASYKISDEFFGTRHASVTCVTCHGGDDTQATKDAAHTATMIQNPSANGGANTACIGCHKDETQAFNTSLHNTANGILTKFTWRMQDTTNGAALAQGITDALCGTCHVSCGECHVSEPKEAVGHNKYGLIRGHVFSTKVPTENCATCHHNIAPLYLGHAIADGSLGNVTPITTHTPDLHATAGLECIDCHKDSTEMHGKGGTVPANMNVPGVITTRCTDCHSMETLKASPTHSNTHMDKVTCFACHADSYQTCYTCHVDRNTLGEMADTTLESALGVGADGRLTNYSHNPIDKDMFKNTPGLGGLVINIVNGPNTKPIWVEGQPHSIQPLTRNQALCDNCHSATANKFLKFEDLEFNKSLFELKILYTKVLPTVTP